MDQLKLKNRFNQTLLLKYINLNSSAKWLTEEVVGQINKLAKVWEQSINAAVTIHNDFHTIQLKMNVVMEKYLAWEAASEISIRAQL